MLKIHFYPPLGIKGFWEPSDGVLRILTQGGKLSHNVGKRLDFEKKSTGKFSSPKVLEAPEGKEKHWR